MLMGPDQKQEIASYILPEVKITDLGIVGMGGVTKDNNVPSLQLMQ